MIGATAEQMRIERSEAVARFVAGLETGLKEKPLILKDDTVPASILNEGLEK